jgi:hypothetical protein
MDQKLYAWTASGNTVSGFPMTPVSQTNEGNPHDVGFSPVLGDYDGDGKMEIFVRVGWGITIVDGNGQQLTTTTNPPNGPFFFADALMQNNPALGDIDNDGEIEMVAHNSNLYAWDLPGAGNKADWPMFRHNAARTGHPTTLMVEPKSITRLHDSGDSSNVVFILQLSGIGGGEINWSASGSGGVSASPANGQVDGSTTTVTVTVSRGSLSNGQNNKSITFSGVVGNNPVANSPLTVPITIYLLDDLSKVYLPSIAK